MDITGLLTIYSLENIAPVGHKPVEKLVKIEDAYYEERRAGVSRIYQAMGADHRFDLLVRCFNTDVPHEGLYVVIDDDQFRIDVCQKVIGQDAVDLTLIKLENYYDVASEQITENTGHT